MTATRTAPTPGRKPLLTIALGVAASLALATFAFAPGASNASSHREAPLTAADPQVDNTDVYAFVSPDNPATVTLVSNWIPFEEPAGGPNFYSFAEGVRYDVNISNDGDASPEIVYRWRFRDHYRNPNTFLYNTGQVTTLDDEDLNFYQTYTLTKIRVGKGSQTIVRGARVAPSDVGRASIPNYETLRDEAVVTAGAGAKAFAGQTNDPFFLDLRVFDLLYGADFSEVGDDTLRGFNTNTMVLQVPKTEVAKSGNPATNPVVGVWSTASRRSTRIQKADGSQSFRGRWVQLSRLGMPLVNEVVVPVGAKDYFNASKPKDDEQFLGAVDDPELPRLIEAIYGIPAPDSNEQKAGIQRDDLIQVFLTGIPELNQPANVEPAEMLRLNLNVAPCEQGTCEEYSRLGVIGGDTAGFPNGRRLADDVLDIALQVVEGELIGNPNDLGDAVDADDQELFTTFPYVSLPTRGSDPAPHQE
ncbi:MAG TPA: DUF4331 domain-containing protein [Actinomycetota bacterium]|nr:DUF4331 domain-containing protein [Actinomycetota bacterium]